MIDKKNTKIAIIGLGYVGLPLAVEFGKLFSTIGFDINSSRIEELKKGFDVTKEVDGKQLSESSKLTFTEDDKKLKNCNIFIITVPTPIDSSKNPDLRPLILASETVGNLIKKNDLIIYESTVYPGATEEICVPILERVSCLKFNLDFFCGYSPERINPGDKKHRIQSIMKVTSGSNIEIANKVDYLYKTIIKAGTYKASSIKVAEAAKVIENTQRDVNIALINELAIIFNKLGIDTEEVLNAAGSKWNFLNFRPGLVGGHCIGVDPYYLTFKAAEIGYKPEIILAGRKINDGMGSYIAHQLKQLMVDKCINSDDVNILIMGLAFKENCPDIRNTRVLDLINALKEFGFLIDVYDPVVNKNQAVIEYGVIPITKLLTNKYDGIVIAVAHDEFLELGEAEIHKLGKKNHVLYDVKYMLPLSASDGRL